jgi:hypothetical protein
MIDRRWDDDDDLLAALGEAMRYANAVPRHFVEAGKAAFAAHDIDAELAALTYDSADAAQYAMTREQPASLRALTFASTQLTIHIELTREAIHGQVVPEQAGEIEVRVAQAPSATIGVDEVGWFVIRPIPTKPFRLRCRPADGSVVLTDWINL